MVAQRTASVRGFNDPAAKGAMVRGMREADTRRSKVQWYEPCVGFVGGIGAGSFAIEFISGPSSLSSR